MNHNNNRTNDITKIPLTRISWEPDVTENLETWIRHTARGNYQDFTLEIENYFEKELGRPCIAVSSGTAALHLALRFLNLKPGAEVILPTLTYAACANAVLYEGLRPVFCDVNPDTWCLDAERFTEALENRIKTGAKIGAVMPVHLYGQGCSLTDIGKICNKHNVRIIEDVAQALGGKDGSLALGSIGDYACFSFNANKTLTGMGGGLLALQSEEEKRKAKNSIRHGRMPFEAGLAHYIHQEMGFNYLISGYSAALIHFQLPHLQQRLQRKKEIHRKYESCLVHAGHMEAQSKGISDNHTRWLSCFSLLEAYGNETKRDDLCRWLNKKEIETRPVFKPLHEQPAYAQSHFTGGDNANHIAQSGICLPSSCDMRENDQEQVIEVIEKWFAC